MCKNGLLKGGPVVARTYKSQDSCPVARTLDIVGDRWTFLVLRDLIQGRLRYNDLLNSLEGISPNLLADRLKRLEEEGIVKRGFYSDHPPRAEYHLTAKGRALRPVVNAIRKWGREYVLDKESTAST
ncbi:MAG: helix-turn-helix domain-containing protein [Dehalococcoidia bacterium]